MSNLGGDIQELVKLQTASKDREDRLKHAKERQKEERQKKIEELRAHAEAAQKYREQKEEERRRRMEEIKLKELEKRQLVEERKKAIIEAEKERREYILRKNQERVCRLEIKKKDQNTVGFAFGSSTPRLLEPATFGMVSPSIFWYNRRSTSISNVAGAALSRRSSERELSNIESRKRLTYATGNDEEKLPDVIFRSVARRKTDLMPTIPIRRDDYYSSRTSLSNTPKTQGRAYSLTRLDQLSQPVRHNGEHIRSILERQRNDNKPKKNMDQNFKNASSTWNSGISQSMTHLVEGRQRNTGSGSMKKRLQCYTKPKLASTILYKKSPMEKFLDLNFFNADYKEQYHSFTNSKIYNFNSNILLNEKLIKYPGSRSGNVTPKKSSSASRPSSAMSSSTIGISSNFTRRSANDGPKPRPASIAGTAVGLDEMKYAKKIMKSKSNNLSPVSHASAPKKIAAGMSNSFTTYSFPSEDRKNKPENDRTIASTTKSFNQRTFSSDHLNGLGKQTVSPNQNLNNTCPKEKTKHVSSKHDLDDGGNNDTVKTESIEIETSVPKIDTIIGNSKDSNHLIMNQSEEGDLGSTSAKSKITTEEEAKAALAERRRLAREEAERQAALERERIEAERQMELLRQTAEAEAQRRFEEEATRLAQEQREAEEKRLQLAIEEAQQKEDEEKRKREEEERQRLEREENDKKVKEEAERQRLEVDERLKREEKEREARRKRVEAIMSRTRKGTNMNSNSNKEESVNQQESTDLPYPLSRNENNISTADMTMTESFSLLNNSNTDVNNLHLHTENLNSILSNLSINENLKNDQAEYQPENDKVKMSILQDELESSNNYFLPNSMAVVVTNGNNHIENLNKK